MKTSREKDFVADTTGAREWKEVKDAKRYADDKGRNDSQDTKNNPSLEQ
jgi:hypothetical protein